MLFLSANEIRPIGLVDFPQFPLSLDIGAVHFLCPASAQVPAPAAALAAAVTSAVRLVEATVNDVMGLCAAVKVREQDTAISFRLPGGLAPTAESTCQNLLTGLMVYLAQLHDEYPENIEVMEA